MSTLARHCYLKLLSGVPDALSVILPLAQDPLSLANTLPQRCWTLWMLAQKLRLKESSQR